MKQTKKSREEYLVISGNDVRICEGLADTAHVLVVGVRKALQQPALREDIRVAHEAVAMMRDQLDIIEVELQQKLDVRKGGN